jgi:serine/threonine protein kinase/WD40 repeat protein
MNAAIPDAKEIFFAALDQSPEGLSGFLDAACEGHSALRSRVEQLLRAHHLAGRFLGGGATVDAPSGVALDDQIGTQIGPYKLLQQIGEGGMGVVYLAEQNQPVRRNVALKVIKPGMDSRQVIARFEAERQALAMMDHVNIARVFDGGATENGRPYFVMEVVHGIPITKYCDDNRLTTRQRLELFVPVCQAIQHAHQKGIIHRDIKPSNVMVTLYDGNPVAKIIDFGVAKATEQKLTERTLFTQYGTMVGTLEYMSPEQAEMSALGVDTRSDIYSLGVLLYELLTGSTPLTRARVREAAYVEVLRIIKEEEPPRPSTRLSESGEALASISARRHTEPAKLSKLVRGELDWIVMKTLEKDRNRRYETAGGLAADVERYLNDEPVQACPPSATYRLRKFVRRNKGPVLGACLLVLTLLAGIIGTTLGMIRATGAEAVAMSEANQKGEALKGKEVALTAAQRSKREADERLFESYVSQAQAFRMSRRCGQRFESLAVLRRATELARALDLPAEKLHDLRSAAIASLALPDLYLTGPWNSWPADTHAFDVDEAHALFARTDRLGVCSVRRVADDAEMYSLPGLGGPALPNFSRDGRFLAVVHLTKEGSAATGVAVQLWSLEDPNARRILSQDSEDDARYIDFHPSGRQVALAYNDGTIRAFELPGGQPLGPSLPPDTLTREVVIALHPTEPLVAVCSYFGSVVQIRDVNTGEVVASLPQSGSANSVAWNADGQTLAVGHAHPPLVLLYDRTTLEPYKTMEAAAADLYFNHTGDRLATRGWDGRLGLFDVGTGQELIETRGAVRRFSRDDRRLAGAVQDGRHGFLQVGDGREYRTLVRKSAPEKSRYQGVTLHPDGRLLACGMPDGFGLWDLASGNELRFTPMNEGNYGVMDVRFESSGALLTAGYSGLLRWPVGADPKSPDRRLLGPPQRLLPRASFIEQSQDGRVTAVCNRAVGVWEEYAGGWILHADRPNEPIRLDAGADVVYLAVDRDGRWIVTVDWSTKLAKVWDARDGRLEKELAGWGGNRPRFSPDGRWLSGEAEGRIFAVGSWKPGPRVGVAGAFAPDSRLMAVQPTIGVVGLVDRATGREYARLEDPHFQGLASPFFTPDGGKLIGLAQDNGIRIWDLRLIRQQLAQMGLDWKYPEFPPADSASKPTHALRAEVLLGDFVAPVLTSEQKTHQCIERYRLALETNPDDAGACNNLAWQYVAGPDSLRDPNSAVPLAEKAVQLDPENAVYCNTLGVAYYRAGRHSEAAKVLRGNLDRDDQWSRAFDLYVLAMSCHQLGEAAQARDYYDWATRWPPTHPLLSPGHLEDLNVLRAEAEELLKQNR